MAFYVKHFSLRYQTFSWNQRSDHQLYRSLSVHDVLHAPSTETNRSVRF